MRAKPFALWIAAGVALGALTACDQVQARVDQFGKLVGDVMGQVSGDEASVDPLQAAPLEARALFGVRQAAVEPPPMSLDEMLSTQSFFAVGSVIAKPKEEIEEPVVDPETFDLAAAEPDAAQPAPAPDAAGAAGTAPADLPDSAKAPAGPPVQEAPPPAPPTADQPSGGGAASPNRVLRSAPILTAPELRKRAGDAPKALEKDVKDAGVRIDRDALMKARRAAEITQKAGTADAQKAGDEIARQAADKTAPVPRALAVRSKLRVDAAVAARDKAYNKLEQLGLSGVVTPEEGGQMRILIGVKPTKLGDKIDPTKIASMRDMFALKKEKDSDECKGDHTAADLQKDAVLATECVVKVLKETGDYEYVEKDYIFTNQMMKKPKKPAATVSGYTPNDPLFGLQWNLKDYGTAAGQSGGGASFSNFWTRAKDIGSRNVTVAVVDTGLQMNHPDIKGSANLAPGYDMVSDPTMGNDGDGRDNDPNDPGDKCDPNDPTATDTFHGTHVAGTIGVASTNNAAGIAGGAWNVTIVPVRALGRCGGKLSDINDAIRWAAGKVPARDAQGNEVWNTHPADIINLSIGLFEPCPASMQAAIDDAVARGSIVVAAAGNARIDTKYFAPGGCKNVISVAAGDARGILAPYSNFGAGVSLMAPGGDMSRDDDGDGRPDGILSTKFSTDCYDPAKPGVQVAQCYYSYENGTSMAAPHVSAALALLKAKFPSAVPSDLRNKLLAASTARTPLQCSGKCSSYPGTEPIPGQDGMCFRPCGGRMLNLANAAVQ
jgi:serine protease